MATSLGYTPPTPPQTGASDEVDDLVRALHESGLLRALAGAVRSYPRLLLLALDAVDADTLRSTIALAGSLRGLDPGHSERVAAGVREARAQALEATQGKPEGPLTLLRRLRDPDTRRGISAALGALAAIGAAVAETPKEREDHAQG